ncbi:alpha/beta hydrolase [Paucilactobacillus suebicus]|uniref:Alpha/beta hydrolase fold-5 domain-containing protein n=1 Tax=Paucilactobacillus suebicus DSM 5007 = KCTC 3549 TaxID=1423807 RepID=A0A0R1W2T8_9LACO|nr:alpha/beta hydrolase [Paucilactobacillus suebicus]KRM11823.1 hypothetical protein FD16_GL000493 [Paucilactobacillus suebicus DSM 5007 = KCTC 3549]
MFKKRKRYVAILVFMALLIGLVAYVHHFVTSISSTAQTALKSNSLVKVTNGSQKTVFKPKNGIKRALIYYPGATVTEKGFSYVAQKLAKNKTEVFVVHAPYYIPLIKMKSLKYGDQIRKQHPQIKHWFMMGYSQGGRAASFYLLKTKYKYDGFILNDSIVSSGKGKSLYQQRNNFTEPVLAIRGTKDGMFPKNTLKPNHTYYPKNTQFVAIKGANHSNMTMWNGASKIPGDEKANITKRQQNNELSNIITKFMNQNM